MNTTRRPHGPTNLEESLETAWMLRDSAPEAAHATIAVLQAETDEAIFLANAAVLRAFLLYRRGDLHDALPLVLDAIALFADSPLSRWHGRASNTGGLIYSSLGLPEAAVELLLTGQQQSQQIGDGQTAFSCFHNMGVELSQMGDYEGALENYAKAELFAEAGQEGKAFLALNRCDLHLDRGHVAEALATVQVGREYWQVGNSQVRVFGLLVEARVALAAEDHEAAAEALASIRTEYDAARAGAELPILEARLCLLRGDLDGADEVLRAHDMEEGSTAIEDVYLAARLVQLHAELAETRGDYRRALAIVRSARNNENRERRQSMSRVTTLIMTENTRQLEQKSKQLEARNVQLNEAIEELRQLHAQVHELAVRDHLTGLHNRRYLAEHVTDVVKHHHRHGRDLSLLVFDIDNFKHINDTYLHSTGDVVLQRIATLLKAQKRAGDVVCRLGGDEFVALLPETDIDGARSMAHRIHAAVQGHQWSSVAPGLSVGVSVGATTALAGDTLEDLLLAADRAMYGAKSAGKNQVHVGPVALP